VTEVIRAAADLQALCESEDWLDVEGILIRQGGRLDWSYARGQLKPLAELKGAPEILDELERRRNEFER
jgi:hypothetical protein